MGRKISVLYLIDSLEPGGAEQSLVEMLPGLLEKIEISLVLLRCTDTILKKKAQALGVRIHCVDRMDWRATFRIRSILKKTDPDILHTTLFYSNLWGRLATLGLRIIRVVSYVNMHELKHAREKKPGPKWKRRIADYLDRFLGRYLTDFVHANSKSVFEDVRKRLSFPPEKIRIVYRGRSRERLGYPSAARREKVRKSLGVGNEQILAITIGRQDVQKGYPVLLQAAKILQERNVPIMFMCAGKPGIDTPQIEKLMQTYDLRGRVFFLGHRDDVGDLLSAGDIFVLPSLWEGLPGSVIEAMAMGLPVVASDLPPLHELVDEKGAILVPPGDADALAKAIWTLVQDPDLRERMGKHNMEVFEKRFSIEQATQGMVEFYQWAIENYGR